MCSIWECKLVWNQWNTEITEIVIVDIMRKQSDGLANSFPQWIYSGKCIKSQISVAEREINLSKATDGNNFTLSLPAGTSLHFPLDIRCCFWSLRSHSAISKIRLFVYLCFATLWDLNVNTRDEQLAFWFFIFYNRTHIVEWRESCAKIRLRCHGLCIEFEFFRFLSDAQVNHELHKSVDIARM